MREAIYTYDGSFEGFLCCIFDSYVNHESPADICPDSELEPTLFPIRAISTDADHARRVLKKMVLCAPELGTILYHGFLTCLSGREAALYRLTAKVLRDGPGFLRNFSDETLHPVAAAIRHLHGEAQLLRGFVRFSELGGVLGAEIEPKNHVLPLLRGHFCARFQNETFFIYDHPHREALFYASGSAVIAPLEQFTMAPPDEREAAYRMLWKRFYDTVAIRERENPRCRMTHMPKRYWNTMTEFQEPSYFKAQSSPAAAPAPGAPAGRSAPGRLPAPWPSAPVSAP